MARKKSGLGAFAGGLFAGAAFGAAAGLLFAPRKGKETQRIIRKSMDKLPELAGEAASSAQVKAGKVSAAAAERLVETLERLRVAAAAGLVASQVIAQASEDDSELEGADWDDGSNWQSKNRTRVDRRLAKKTASRKISSPKANGAGNNGHSDSVANLIVESRKR